MRESTCFGAVRHLLQDSCMYSMCVSVCVYVCMYVCMYVCIVCV